MRKREPPLTVSYFKRFKILFGAFILQRNFSKCLRKQILLKILRRCADPVMVLGKMNHYLLLLKRESITPELDMACKHFPFPQGEHPKLLFGNDLPKAIKELTETHSVGHCLLKKINFT